MKSSRLKTNSNLVLFSENHYNGMRVYTGRGPLVLQYLQCADRTISRAMAEYPRLLAIRFDLHYPGNQPLSDDAFSSCAIQRFVESLKAKIRHDRLRAVMYNQRVHDTDVMYLWAREYSQQDRPHYHFLLMLNRNAYHTLGQFSSDRENMYSRIQAAWASALGIPWDQSLGLVHIPNSPIYYVNSADEQAGLDELFYRVSYLCKAASKKYGAGEHAFGASRG